jgi:Na+-driven multidrug efflux pump
MIKSIAIIMAAICYMFFIGGAALLCAYKNWSLWAIFWSFVLAYFFASVILEAVGLETEPLI